MTAKRKGTGELEVIRWGLSTQGFRVALLILVLSMHPAGRKLLSQVGFQFEDDKRLGEATEAAQRLTTEVKGIKDDVGSLKDDARSLKANNSILNEKVDGLTANFTGFKIDFDSYRNNQRK